MQTLENDLFKIIVNENGAISSFFIKTNNCELIEEKSLASNFRICLPLEDYQCNYIDGTDQSNAIIEKENNKIKVSFSNMESEKGTFPISLSYSISLVDDQVVFHSNLINECDIPVSEFWFPRIGGWKQFGSDRNAKLATPGYLDCNHDVSLFKNFPGRRDLGAEAAEWLTGYPGMVMPWWDIFDEQSDTGLYMGYHDTILRSSMWHTYLCPNISGHGDDKWLTKEESCGNPVGLIFSHVRFPYIKSGESFDSGDFIIRVHKGDWHQGSLFYRDWFMKHFPFDKSKSWLRKKSAWFSSVIYQPEDKIIADYKTYDKWCQDAEKSGVTCHELIGWDKGGLERDYPEYVPEEKLGGQKGFEELLKSIDGRNSKSLVFVNYNILDTATKWFKDELNKYAHQDTFGNTPNWMCWGESTLTARTHLSVRRHILSSVIPEIENILFKNFENIAKSGAHGLQIDKLCVGSAVDFNPMNKLKPDIALCEGLINSVARMIEKCRKINPDFCIAAEAVQDRLIPYVDVFYRNSTMFSISPLKYVFPEWTSCQHIGEPYNFNGVNSAVMTGSVICVEPDCYQQSLGDPLFKKLAEYIKEVESIRAKLAEFIFLGNYFDKLSAEISVVKNESNTGKPAAPKQEIASEVMIPGGGGSSEETGPASELHYRVHGEKSTGKKAIVVINPNSEASNYTWKFSHNKNAEAELYEPFEQVKSITSDNSQEIKGYGLHIIIEKSTIVP